MVENKLTKAQIEKQKAIYACTICKGMFKESGMCPDCDGVLKKHAG